ncbi:putative Rho guanine nucleotide exchange factor 11 [Operophtera brumata]|uniref:Putative Rho guanine nucleotide exchange factor 11 n=1 Tax=Operophtera brumata TaxID=104452 RepID=A0A0L7KSZ9_OPEBR|nr:putative Rho guanine nucleotide exchange factor 11 [Operophtera brumata]
MVQMMWFKRDPKPVSEKAAEKENGVVSKLRKKKPSLLKPTRESSERETSTESDKDRRRYSDILDMKVSLERRDESDESLYESADGHSDAISASDDTLPRLSKTPTMSKESLKLAVTDEEVEIRFKKGHRKAMSLSNPIEMVKNLGDEWLVAHKKDLEKNSDKKKSKESLWSEEDRDSINGSSTILDQIRKNSRKEDKTQINNRKISTTDAPKTRKTSKGSSVSALNFLRRKKTPTSAKPVEVVPEDPTKVLTIDEILNHTRHFLECEKRFASIENRPPVKTPVETDSEDEGPTPKQLEQHRRRLSRQTSRSKSKVRGKSQSLKVNTLRKSHSGTLKKSKKGMTSESLKA